MERFYNNVIGFLVTYKQFIFGVLVGLFAFAIYMELQETEYSVIEDNSVETILAIQQNENITTLTINRYEDGGGFWVTTYDGKGVPEVERMEMNND